MIDVIDYIFDHFRRGLPQHREKIVRQSLKQDSPLQFILVSIYEGQYSRHTTRQAKLSLQVLVQHDTDELARQLALDAWEFFAEDFDVQLATPVGKAGDPLTISSIVPIAIPAPLGNVGNGKYRYTTNYTLILGDP